MTQIYTARKQFYRLWHQHETPSGFWGRYRKRTVPPVPAVTVITVRRRRARAKARLDDSGQRVPQPAIGTGNVEGASM